MVTRLHVARPASATKAPTARPWYAQPKLRVSAPDDAREREADRAAHTVLAPPTGDHCACCAGDRPGARPAPHAVLDRAAAPIGTGHPPAALHPTAPSAGGGEPLSPAVRAGLEPRFGVDFAHVRVHTDTAAARSASRFGALAYTVGSDIVFGSGQYAPSTASGRRLIAHELAHVVQQSGGRAGPCGPQLSSVEGTVQRSAAMPCPAVSLPFDAFPPLPAIAEKVIQEEYVETHAGNTVGMNKSWVFLNGRDPAEKAGLGCLKGNFVGKSGMWPGEPDIWDFSNRTMYEITTASGAAFRNGKIKAELVNASKIAGTMECGGNIYSAGSWAPKGPCYPAGGDFYVSNPYNNGQGIIIYRIIKDMSKELVLSALLATLAAGVKSGMFQSMGKGLLGATGKKLLPGYAIASLVATIVLIGSGRAEAKPGPGGGEPLVELFKALAAKGEPVPPEVQQMIESDPELKKAIEDAMTKGGDPTDAQKKLSAKMMKLIADNKDQFSAADLEVLLAVTQGAGKQMPDGDLTAADLKKRIAAAKAGQPAGTGAADKGTGTADKGSGTADKGSGTADKGSGTADKGTGSGDKGTGTADKGTASAKGGLGAAAVAKIKAATPGPKMVFDAMFGPNGPGPKLTDPDVDRFFSLLPSDLDLAKAKVILSKLKAYQGASIDDVLNGLATVAAGELSPVATDTTAGAGTGGGAPPPKGATVPESESIAALAKIASSGNFAGLNEGGLRFSTFKYTVDDLKPGNTLTVTVIGVIGGKRGAAVASIRVTTFTGGVLEGTYVYSSQFVDAKANIIAPGGALSNKQSHFNITGGTGPAKGGGKK